ncbi:MAG TPA: Na+/H+ antiporter NhaC family protein, partial [bacterium]|nr:Na+/H+ antiporter NhaC family protein [bacterium]
MTTEPGTNALSWITLIPIFVVVLTMAISKRAVLSFFLGLLSAIFCGHQTDVLTTAKRVLSLLAEKTEITHALRWSAFNNSSYLFILLSTLMIGLFINLLYNGGGAGAFGGWVGRHIKNRKSAMLITFALSLVFFFDHFFHCVMTGTIMRPATDRLRISRVKLAYIIDASAAAICVLVPFTVWGNEITNYLRLSGIGTRLTGDPVAIFCHSLLFCFFAWLSLYLVLLVATTRRDFGPMKVCELEAQINGALSANQKEQDYAPTVFCHGPLGKPLLLDFVLPLIVLLASFVVAILQANHASAGHVPQNLIKSLQQTNMARVLFWGSFSGLSFTCLYCLARKLLSPKELGRVLGKGFLATLPYLAALILAWVFGSIIGQNVKTGEFLCGFLKQTIAVPLLPVLVFGISLIFAFVVGSAWVTFAVMIPLLIPIVV